MDVRSVGNVASTYPTVRSEYKVGGYREGDRVGMGVVVDPLKLTSAELKETKLVTVDLNLNGESDDREPSVCVKLPPKGFVPADWKGPAANSLLKNLTSNLPLNAAGGLVGAVLASPFLETSTFPKTFTGIVLTTSLAIPAAIMFSQIEGDARGARLSVIPDLVPPKKN